MCNVRRVYTPFSGQMVGVCLTSFGRSRFRFKDNKLFPSGNGKTGQFVPVFPLCIQLFKVPVEIIVEL